MASNKYNLTGKTILITGASSGIGKQAAVDISESGANCIITGKNNIRLQETFNSLKQGGHISFLADLTNNENLEN
ncbi:MAG TPA: SDR family NAD(P)-dependent oxidoreductase, partial [Bacteroidales bacterium]|nr:SDR family NAD(P)-dependent oxidoreductase [Bacteroidales bacterium]